MPTPSSADKALNALLRGDNNYNLPSDRPSYLPRLAPNQFQGQTLTPTGSYSPTKFGKQLTIPQLNQQYNNLQSQLNSVTGNDSNSVAYRANIQANMSANIQARQQIGGNQAIQATQTIIGAMGSAYLAGLNTQYMVNTSNQAYINTKLRPNLVGSANIPMPKNSMGGWHVKGQTTSNANVPNIRNITNVSTVVSSKSNAPPQPKYLRGTTPSTTTNSNPTSANNPNSINSLRQRLNNFLNIFKNCP